MKVTDTMDANTEPRHNPHRSGPPRFILNVQTTPPTEQKQTSSTVHVLVIAHPDDESMFFLPTLSALKDAGETVWILCLTTGNYDGLGETRQKELSQVCSQVLKVDRLLQLNVEALQDHPTQSWNLEAVTLELERALSAAIRNNNSSVIQQLVLITFDVDGVSGHINHRDTYLGVKNLIYKHQQHPPPQDDNNTNNDNNHNSQSQPTTTTITLPPMTAWQLETVHFMPLKYLPVVEWVRLMGYWCWIVTKPRYTSLSKNHHNNNTASIYYRSVNGVLSWRAMSTHRSQWVWYRRLFVIFSCYTFVNKLKPVQ